MRLLEHEFVLGVEEFDGVFLEDWVLQIHHVRRIIILIIIIRSNLRIKNIDGNFDCGDNFFKVLSQSKIADQYCSSHID